MDTLTIRAARVREPGVAALIDRHFALMRAGSPEESCHVMSPDMLDRENVWMMAAEISGAVAGVAGLKALSRDHGEIKSMHTADNARGRGIGRRLLHALIEEARGRGLKRLSLETGTAETFAPARALYVSEGFVICGPFAGYSHDPFSVFMTREL